MSANMQTMNNGKATLVAKPKKMEIFEGQIKDKPLIDKTAIQPPPPMKPKK